ncbi:PROF1 protein, partial [Spizella passerina]|nr:PROF1 protein [Spizella passerina]
MSGWAPYVETLLADGTCQDAAIVGYRDTPAVWAAAPGKTFANITPWGDPNLVPFSPLTQLPTTYPVLTPAIPSSLPFCPPVCLSVSGPREPRGDPHHVPISAAIVLAMGKEGVHGGCVNKKCYEMANHLRRSQY